MKGLPFVLAFTAMTFLAWGAYGPLLHHGTLSMGKDSLRAFVGVGIAYFFIAVLVPIYILRSQGETGKWTVSGTFYSLIAGAVGAVGALGVILALSYGGLPVYVMPLVFGFAPIVNTLVTAWMSKTFDQISPIFIGGIVVASLGVGGVLAFKPVAPPHAAPHSDSKSKDPSSKGPSSKGPSSKGPSEEKSKVIEHARLDRAVLLKLVSTVVAQEPVSEDLLPPVVVQPAAPGPSTAVPQAQPPLPAPPVAPPIAPVAESQELPPVVVQPLAPQDTQLAATTPAATTPAIATAEIVQEPKAELPPTIVQPTPLQQADAKANAPVEPVKPEPVKPEPTKQEPAKQEPVKQEPVKVEPEQPSVTDTAKQTPTETPADTQPATEAADNTAHGDKPSPATSKAPTAPDVPMIILSIVVAAFCWGSYGPMLHQGQARMGGSRLRPFTCVGLAYFFIAVAAPLAVIYGRTADMGSWSVGGLSWSIIAGAAGAIGALGVILAFNAGGKPYYVMPLVFGFAPVINTCISLTENGTWGLATPKFWISLAVVIAGAITVLLTAPKPKHAKPAT